VTTTGFPFDSEYEEAAISTMTAEQASASLATIKEALEKYTSKKKKGKKAKKTATGDEEPRESSEKGDKEDPSNEGEGPSEHEDSADKKADDESTKQKGAAPDDSDDSDDSGESSSSSDEDDLRKRTSRRDKQSIRGRTPRVETGGNSSKKLFKMDPPEKYSGEKDSDRTYAVVHKFLSQLSRYFHLATNVDMDKDISEYVLGSLDGFAFEWFDMWDKGKEPFVWEKFESAFRGKFIPKEHIQMAINKYLAIRQRERPVSEYIVERERLEATLGKVAVDEI